MRWVGLLLCVASITCVTRARAQGGDGLYGRWNQDLTVSVGVSAAFTDRGEGAVLAPVHLRYLDFVGLTLTPTWAWDADLTLWTGFEIRPLFPSLFLSDASLRTAFWDRLVQSLAFQMGPEFGTNRHHRLTTAWSLGTSVDVPIVFPSGGIAGLALTLAARHTLRSSNHIGGGPVRGGDSRWLFSAGLTWRFGIPLGLVSREVR